MAKRWLTSFENENVSLNLQRISIFYFSNSIFQEIVTLSSFRRYLRPILYEIPLHFGKFFQSSIPFFEFFRFESDFFWFSYNSRAVILMFRWFLEKTPTTPPMQICKYRQRGSNTQTRYQLISITKFELGYSQYLFASEETPGKKVKTTTLSSNCTKYGRISRPTFGGPGPLDL